MKLWQIIIFMSAKEISILNSWKGKILFLQYFAISSNNAKSLTLRICKKTSIYLKQEKHIAVATLKWFMSHREDWGEPRLCPNAS